MKRFFPVFTVPVFAAVFAVAFGSCQTIAVIPRDMPPAKIIQKAQEASDVNKYKIALQYYEALRDRFGDRNEYLFEAEYEIAFIHYKQKRYAEAKKEFESLLSRYEDPDSEILPGHFRILSEKVLSKIIGLGF